MGIGQSRDGAEQEEERERVERRWRDRIHSLARPSVPDAMAGGPNEASVSGSTWWNDTGMASEERRHNQNFPDWRPCERPPHVSHPLLTSTSFVAWKCALPPSFNLAYHLIVVM
jgi:hypothetical protein